MRVKLGAVGVFCPFLLCVIDTVLRRYDYSSSSIWRVVMQQDEIDRRFDYSVLPDDVRAKA